MFVDERPGCGMQAVEIPCGSGVGEIMHAEGDWFGVALNPEGGGGEEREEGEDEGEDEEAAGHGMIVTWTIRI
jgi:hypothetical protein